MIATRTHVRTRPPRAASSTSCDHRLAPQSCRQSLKGRRAKMVRPRRRRPPKTPESGSGAELLLAVLGMPAAERPAPTLCELVAALLRFGELDVDEDTATLLSSMSEASTTAPGRESEVRAQGAARAPSQARC